MSGGHVSWNDLIASLRGERIPDPKETRERRVRGLLVHLRRGLMELQAALPGPDPDQTYGVYDRQVAPLLRALRRELGPAADEVAQVLDDLQRTLEALAGLGPVEGRTPFELAFQALAALAIVEYEGLRKES